MAWIRGPAIGSGATATVHIASEKFSGELFAVKSAELSRSAPLRNEQYLLSKLPSYSPRIVKHLGFSVDDSMYNLCMEYVPNGTLSDAIRAKGKLDEASIRLYARQILEGLRHLHENSIAHCDIKAQNVLIGEDWGAKIADLGCGRLVPGNRPIAPDGLIGLFSGTPAFMAPEVARGERQGFEADVWAVGCVVVEMATGNGPWPGHSEPVSVMYRVGFSGSVPECPGQFSAEGRDFLSKCFERDWRARWTVKELLDHPFLLGPETGFGPKSVSPSSVLDKGLWDSVESQSQRGGLLGFEECSVSDSVFGRIEVLSCFSSLCFSDDDGEQWLTVREDESQRDVSENSMVSIIVVDHEENVTNIDEYVFGQELSSVIVISDPDEIFPISSICNNVDLQQEMSNESFCFDSISFLSHLVFSVIFFTYVKKCNQSVKGTNFNFECVSVSPTYSHFLLFYAFS